MRKSANVVEITGSTYKLKSKAQIKAQIGPLDKVVYGYIPVPQWEPFRTHAIGQLALFKTLAILTPAQYRHAIVTVFTDYSAREEWVRELVGTNERAASGVMAGLEWVLGLPLED